MCAQIEQHIRDVGLNKDLEDSVAMIFRDRWDKTDSPLHSAAYMLDPQIRPAALNKQVMHLSLWCFVVSNLL